MHQQPCHPPLSPLLGMRQMNNPDDVIREAIVGRSHADLVGECCGWGSASVGRNHHKSRYLIGEECHVV